MELCVDWSELPQEIIELISKRITIYADYLRFRCVCRTWNSSVPRNPVHLAPQLPWLMISNKTFFDLSTNKFHRLNHLPRPGLICGSSHGWLVILKQTSELSLLNLITRATISLPFLHAFYDDLVTELFHHSDNNLHLIKVVLSSNPSLGNDFAAFAVLNRKDFVFCKKGYKSWVHLNHAKKDHYKWVDAVYKNGSFFVSSMTGTIAAYDIEGSQLFIHENTSISSYFINKCYTMLAGEDMLLVKQLNDRDSTVTGFKIFKLDWNLLEWEEINIHFL